MTELDLTEARAALAGIDPFGFAAVMQAIGTTLWHIQLLEETVATYLVLKLGFDGAVAREAAEAVLEKTKRRTLGQIVREINGKATVPDEISERLSAFVESRNWLVHRSQSDCGVLLRTASGREQLEATLERIAREGLAVQTLMADELEEEMLRRGMSKEKLQQFLMQEACRRTGA